MDDKHIFSTSKWKRFLDLLENSKQDIQKWQNKYTKYKDERKTANIKTMAPVAAKAPKEETKVKKNIAPKITYHETGQGNRLTSPAGDKLLAYSLITSVVIIMLIGIVISTIGSRKSSKKSYSQLQTPSIYPSTKINISPTATPSPTPTIQPSPTS